MPWSARACFSRKTVLLDIISVELVSVSSVDGTCTPNAVQSTAASSLGGAFLLLENKKAFSRVFCTNGDISTVFYTVLGQVPICPISLSLMELPVWQPADPSLDFCQMLVVMCFGSWTSGLFLAKNQIRIKMPLMG